MNMIEQHLASLTGDKSSISLEQCVSEEYVDALKKKIQSQVIIDISYFRIRIALFIQRIWLLMGWNVSKYFAAMYFRSYLSLFLLIYSVMG